MDAREGMSMPAMEGVVCAKGEAGSDPDERPAKVYRQAVASGGGTTLSGCSFFAEVGASSSCGVDRGASSSASMDVLAGPCSVFDCSALGGALDSDLLVTSDLPEILYVDPADVFVPGAARPVDISKQMIVKEIARHLQLQLHDFGTIDGIDGLARGYIEMDVPCLTSDGPKMKEKFIGDEAMSQYGAMENVSADVIRELCKGSGVIIKDINYNEMKKLEQKLVEEKRWSSLFSGKLDAKIKEDEQMRSGFENIVSHAKRMCKEFKDVLPIETVGDEDLFLGMETVKVVYNGPRHPVTRMEQLAFDLVALVKKSVDLQVVARQEKTEHVPLKRKRYRCRG